MKPVDMNAILERLEYRLILRALRATKTKAAAAKLLNLKRTTLVEKLRKMGMLK